MVGEVAALQSDQRFLCSGNEWVVMEEETVERCLEETWGFSPTKAAIEWAEVLCTFQLGPHVSMEAILPPNALKWYGFLCILHGVPCCCYEVLFVPKLTDTLRELTISKCLSIHQIATSVLRSQ